MQQPYPDEKRLHQRFALTGKIPGGLCDKKGKSYIHFPVDVSKTGIGVVLDADIAKGEILFFDAPSASDTRRVSLEVMWVRSHQGGAGMFRVGLRCCDERLDLIAVVESIGTLSIEDLS